MLSYLRAQDRIAVVVVITTEKVMPGSFWKREAGAAGSDANNV